MKKATTKKVLAGAAAAAALGAVAGVLMATKAGKKFRHEVKKSVAHVYGEAKPHLKKLKNVGKADFEKVMVAAVSRYATAKKLSLKEKQVLMKEAKGAWRKIKKHL